MLRIKFEKFLNYLQGSMNFSEFIREEITKFGVGQAAVEMAFQTSLRFPGTFILEKIQGEEPLYVYIIDMSDVLTQSELSSGAIQRDYQFEKDELKNKFIEYNISGEGVDKIFAAMDGQSRSIKMLEFVAALKDAGVTIANVVTFLKSLSIDDVLITRIISNAGAGNAQI